MIRESSPLPDDVRHCAPAYYLYRHKRYLYLYGEPRICRMWLDFAHRFIRRYASILKPGGSYLVGSRLSDRGPFAGHLDDVVATLFAYHSCDVLGGELPHRMTLRALGQEEPIWEVIKNWDSEFCYPLSVYYGGKLFVASSPEQMKALLSLVRHEPREERRT